MKLQLQFLKVENDLYGNRVRLGLLDDLAEVFLEGLLGFKVQLAVDFDYDRIARLFDLCFHSVLV